MWIEKNHRETIMTSFPTYETPHRVKYTDVEVQWGLPGTGQWVRINQNEKDKKVPEISINKPP